MKYMLLLKKLRDLQMKIKIFLGILSLIAFVFVLYEFNTSYGLFESNNNMIVNTEIGKWNIYVAGTDLTAGNFVVDSINIVDSQNVKSGKLAPSTMGYFDILIDPRNTSVSVRYDITFDFSSFNGNFSISNIEEITSGNLVRTGENTYTKVIPISDIKNGVTNTIRVYVKWNNSEENNDVDSAIGMIKNNYFSIPVEVIVSQYLGEVIEKYTEN